MRLITTYCCETAERVVQHYGRVELDDGTTIELGSKHDLDAAGWLALAESVGAATKQEPPVETVSVEAEDGTVY